MTRRRTAPLPNMDTDHGYQAELAYWDREISLTGDYPEAMLNRLQPERWYREFPMYLSPYFSELKQTRAPDLPAVLDIGSGPVSMLSYGPTINLFSLIAVDPLAEHYKAALRKYGYASNGTLLKGHGED